MAARPMISIVIHSRSMSVGSGFGLFTAIGHTIFCRWQRNRNPSREFVRKFFQCPFRDLSSDSFGYYRNLGLV